MTTSPQDDFKLSDDDRLYKRQNPIVSTTIEKKHGGMKIRLFVLTALIILSASQAWIWFNWSRDNEIISKKINHLQTTIENSRHQANNIDQQLSATILQDSAQIKNLTEKFIQLEKDQLARVDVQSSTDTALKSIQAISNKVENLNIEHTKMHEKDQSLQQATSQIQQDIAELKKITDTFLNIQTEQQTLRTQGEELNKQIIEIKTLLDDQKISQQQTQANLKEAKLNVQELMLQVAALTETLSPSEESNRSDDLYRQQVNQRLDQLTETIRQLRYPASNQ